MPKPVILFLISSDKQTGPGRVALHHARLLQEAGHQVFFCCHGGGSLAVGAQGIGLNTDHRLHLATRGEVWTLPLDIWRVRRLVRDRKVRIILSYRSPEHLIAGWAVGGRVPIVRFLHQAFAVHGDPASKGLSASGWGLLKKPWTSRVLVPSAADLSKVVERAGQKVIQIPGGVDTIHFSPDRGGVSVRRELGIQDEHVVVGLVSRFKQGRGVDLFLRGVAAASETQPELRALLVGQGADKVKNEMRTLAESLGIADRVAVFSPGSRYEEALAALDIGFLAHPGSAGTADAALELMSMARPVVLTGSVGLLGQLAATRECGLYLPPADEESTVMAISSALAQLAGDPDLRFAMGSAARELMEELFSRTVLQRRLQALSEELAG